MMTEVKEIFEYWKSVMQKERAVFSPGRKAKIKSRLKTFSVDDLKQAIDGCRLSDFHMGRNDNKIAYNSIELIFRNDEKTEFFMDMAQKKKSRSSELEAWING